jgi:protein-S-isoprenylcysteine O-methyltransferase Ste14
MAFECLGWVFLLAGTAVRFWATAYIGSDKEKRLVQDGPYSVCRNPLYFGTFLIALSVAMFLQSGIFAAGVMLAALVYLGPTILFEESCLRGKIGAAYIDYCRRVPRFWPNLAYFHTPPRVSLDVRCLRIESVRALRWAAIPLVAHLVCHFQVLHR